jgi:hypothetical protein
MDKSLIESSPYGKIKRSMKTTNSQILPAPPHLFQTLVAGFDTVTNHIALILFPMGLDALIWLAPRLRLKGLIEMVSSDLIYRSLAMASNAETTEMLNSAEEIWMRVAERFNLLVFLRSYPVGIPSIMSSILPLDIPFGKPIMIEVVSLGSVIALFIMLTFLGVVGGTLYFSLVSQAAVFGKIQWRQQLLTWPWMSLQMCLLSLTWVVLIAGVSLPASCAISIAALGGLNLGQCAVLLYSGLLIWMILPLLFSPHGILINRDKFWQSIKQGIRITRLTLPTTTLFFLSIFLITQGLDFLWRVPPESSWLMLIGIAGHAFVATGVLAASFVYYDRADHWIKSLQNQNIHLPNA